MVWVDGALCSPSVRRPVRDLVDVIGVWMNRGAALPSVHAVVFGHGLGAGRSYPGGPPGSLSPHHVRLVRSLLPNSWPHVSSRLSTSEACERGNVEHANAARHAEGNVAGGSS